MLHIAKVMSDVEFWQAQEWLSAHLIIRVIGVVHVEHVVDRHLVSQLVQHHKLQSTSAAVVMLEARLRRCPQHLLRRA